MGMGDNLITICLFPQLQQGLCWATGRWRQSIIRSCQEVHNNCFGSAVKDAVFSGYLLWTAFMDLGAMCVASGIVVHTYAHTPAEALSLCDKPVGELAPLPSPTKVLQGPLSVADFWPRCAMQPHDTLLTFSEL